MKKEDKCAVSIIVPVYNVQQYLKKCIDSLIYQTLKNIEIILVDDGSPDQSGAICDQYAAQDSRIKVIHKQNAGLGLARNSGLAVAQGEYVAFVDSDDFVSIHLFERLHTLAREYNADVVLGGHKRFWDESEIATDLAAFDGNISVWNSHNIRQYLLDRVGLPPESKEDCLRGAIVCCGIFRRCIIEDNGLQFESERKFIAEDIVFNIDFFPLCHTIVHCNDPLYYYRYNPRSLTAKYKSDRFEKNIVLFQEMYRRLGKQYAKEECFLSMSRYFLKFTRVALIQEMAYIKTNGFSLTYQNIKRICNNSELQYILGQYPYNRLPMKYGIICRAIHKKWYIFILGLLFIHQVKLNNIARY